MTDRVILTSDPACNRQATRAPHMRRLDKRSQRREVNEFRGSRGGRRSHRTAESVHTAGVPGSIPVSPTDTGPNLLDFVCQMSSGCSEGRSSSAKSLQTVTSHRGCWSPLITVWRRESTLATARLITSPFA